MIQSSQFQFDLGQIRSAADVVRRQLLAERNSQGHWIGELSDSALATATAISAISQYREYALHPVVADDHLSRLIAQGTQWLIQRQNHDGGWGDTQQSHSNVATTMLVVAAMHLAGRQGEHAITINQANQYIDSQGRVAGLRRRYGKDKTFAVPILANCAIAGITPWHEVAPLPFEAAVVPQACYRFLALPVVSYAIPALVAIGQAKFFKDPPRNPLRRLIRKLSVSRGLNVLQSMQPSSGGYLEAIPLTSFVVMSLAHTGRADHQVVHQGIRFLVETFRDSPAGDQGSWPIDTNLAAWNTTLAVNALCGNQQGRGHVNSWRPADEVLCDQLLDWLLSCQNTTRHPFTGAAAGGWGWSDLTGAVPDADDTPGALLALRNWLDCDRCRPPQKQQILQAARLGIQWLLDLQNRDQGWPTFCRGWGKLPFDRSGTDITAHVVRALYVWRNEFASNRLDRAIQSGFEFLGSQQLPDGSWYPLWFGNQDHAQEENPVYGTAKVLMAYRDTDRMNIEQATRGVKWLIQNQNTDAGWGGGPSLGSKQAESRNQPASSMQETCLALEVLFSDLTPIESQFDDLAINNARASGLRWVLEAIEQGKYREKWPIGFYFAKLWYYERLYPLVFSVSAIQQVERFFQAGQASHGGKPG